MPSRPEPWLRGPVPGVPATLQPVAHALLHALEEVERVVGPLEESVLWESPGGAASIGFHLAHLAGSTDRLMTYARGGILTAEQRAALARERNLAADLPGREQLLADWRNTVAAALVQLRDTPPSTLHEPRAVGRAGLPSTVLGLLFHAAEHASRHAGQVVTTSRLLTGGAARSPQ